MQDIQSDRCFIVAELSANHQHKLEIALETVKAAKDAGADAIKLQTYTPDTLTIPCRNENFMLQHGTIWDGISLYELYQQAYTPWEWHKPIKELADELGLIFFSTPFDSTAVDFLSDMDVPIYKIASFEITDTGLIEYAASKGKPMLISTGIATHQEIEDAIQACRKVGNTDITLLKCTSQYPADYHDANLNTMVDMKTQFDVKIGLSDHSEELMVPVTAVALGATVIEKHFILNRAIGGPDATFSLTPDQFKEMVQSIRKVEASMGKVEYEPDEKAKQSRVFARSLYVVKDMEAGERFNKENIRSIRPGNGLPPKYLKEVLGHQANTDIKMGTPLDWKFVNCESEK